MSSSERVGGGGGAQAEGYFLEAERQEENGLGMVEGGRSAKCQPRKVRLLGCGS